MILTCELVPRTSWFTNVRAFALPKEWALCKQFVKDRSGERCEICGGRGRKWPVECHEVWRYDDEALTQTLAGLIALCPSCHEVKHIGYAETRGRLAPALAHMARVNAWTIEEARAVAVYEFDRWRQRSQHEWTLDISYLEELGLHELVTRSLPPDDNARS